MDVKVHIDKYDLQVNGRFTYTRQVGDIGDVSTSNSSYTNSFSIIRDSNSTQAMKGLGLPGSTSKLPYVKFPGMLVVDELPIVDSNGWAIVSESNISNYKISIIDGNIDFWKAIEGVTLADLDLSEANYTKDRSGIINSFTSQYQKFIIGYYAKFQKNNPAYDINLLNPAISDKYILDQIFKYINMTYDMSINIDSWTVIGKESETPITTVILVMEAILSYGVFPYDESTNTYNFQFSNLELYEDTTFDSATRKITVAQTALYRTYVEFDKMTARYFIQPRDGDVYFIELPINHYLEVNGQWKNLGSDIYLDESDNIFLRFEPLQDDDLPTHGIYNSKIVGYGNITIDSYLFDLDRIDTNVYSFGDELGKITVKEFVKQIMHRYAFTLFYEDRNVVFLTLDERINASVEDLNKYFIEVQNESYIYLSYAQNNVMKMKYVDDGEDFNNGIIISDNKNLDLEKNIIESFTYSQDKEGVMEMWEYKGQNEGGVLLYEQIKGRFFSVRVDQRNENIQLRDGQTPINSHFGSIPFVDFSKTGFRYFKNVYYDSFENKILKETKFQKILLDMPLSVFMNLDLKKVYYIQQGNFLINKMTYKGLREVEAEIIKIN